jgi:folate-binding protein YgfZ
MALILPDRDFVRVQGPDATDFLNRLVTNDVSKAHDGHLVYAALLTPQGKYLFDFFIQSIDQGFVLDLDGGRAADLIKRLSMYRLRAKVDITNESDSWRVIALDRWPVGTDQPGPRPCPDPRHIRLGARWLVPAVDAARRLDLFENWPSSAYRELLLDLGVPDHGRDLMMDKTFPMDVGFDLINGVDFKKGCYIGQELTARMKHRATVRRDLVLVQVDGAELPPPGTAILAGEREIGQLASGYGSRALAIIRMDKLADDPTAPLSADGQALHLIPNPGAKS